MLFVIILLLVQIATITGLYFLTPDNLYMLFLWVPVGIISGWLFLAFLLFAVLYPFFYFTSPQNKFKHYLIHNFSWLLNRMCRLKITFEGRENVPTNETFVAFGNHKSMLDVFLIYEGVNCVCSAVAKSTLVKIKIVDMFFKVFGVVPLDRENERQGVRDLLKAIKYVENGYSFIIFPEGGIKTRETEEIVNIKPGAFKLATKPQALVLPVSIIGSSKCKGRKWYSFTKVKVIFHKPIRPEEYNS